MSCPYGRGRNRRRPIMQYQYAVDVIGHEDERAQFHLWEMLGDLAPAGLGDAARR